ncbi:hypothetical protein ACFQQB_25525 [Nonomuraea rubra]|uniref:hypothetical protein n=1 Tax=Nonomuraea rubra TaxID=46180 RepID=UPI0036138267
MSFSPRALGMDVPITRRDFFDGIAVSCVAGGATGRTALKPPDPPDAFTVRGDTSEALSVAHALRDGRFWAHAGPPVPTGRVTTSLWWEEGAAGAARRPSGCAATRGRASSCSTTTKPSATANPSPAARPPATAKPPATARPSAAVKPSPGRPPSTP